MRTIKFRGRVPQGWKNMQGEDTSGKIVYGYLVIYPKLKTPNRWMETLEENENYPVEPESVSQLIGFDKFGREVYEGDKIILDGVKVVADMSLIHEIGKAILEGKSQCVR